MRIAIIGSFGSRIPLRKDQIHAPLLLTYNLAIELAKMGHLVTYFGAYDREKVYKNKNLIFDNLGYEPISDEIDEKVISDEISNYLKLVYEQGYLAKILKREDFDLFYSWAAYRSGSVAAITDKPVVLTHHDATNMEAYNLMFKSFARKNIFTIPISKYMSKKLKYLNQLSVVHNAVDTEIIPFYPKPENYFCWLGRVVPAKGLDIAIELSKKIGFRLKFAGPMTSKLGDFGDVSNYVKKIEKLIKNNNKVEYLGTLDQQESYNLIAKSKGLIFPTDGTESFSMVTAESIAAGVPVITFNKGPLPELLDQGKTGFLCETINGMERAIKNIDQIDRLKCREIGVKRFSQKVMAQKYLEQFLTAVKILNNKK